MKLCVSVLSLLVLLIPSAATAAVVFHTLPEQYAIYELPDDLLEEQLAYGELLGYPDTYQFRLAATTTVTVAIWDVDHTVDTSLLSGIVVYDEGQRGVREITRLSAAEADWEMYTDARTTMRYRTGPIYTGDLSPGIYRVEISTPDNEGRYRMLFSAEDSTQSGYFATLRDIRATQVFHGYAWWYMLRTAHVYIPIGIILFGVGIYATWRYARRRDLL